MNLLTHIAYVLSTAALAWVFAARSTVRLHGVLLGYLCFGYFCMSLFAVLRLHNYKRLPSISLFPILIALLNILGIYLIVRTGTPEFFWSVTVWNWLLSILYCVNGNHKYNNIAVDRIEGQRKVLLAFVAVATVAICTTFTPNKHPDIVPYPALAAQILKGKLYHDYPVADKLLTMDNPYNRAARDRILRRAFSTPGTNEYIWDHAFYEGNYYTYFGVVPAVLVYAPYQLLTGRALDDFRSMQVFSGFSILGVFALFFLLARVLKTDVPLSLVLLFSVVFSVLPIYYAIVSPSVYFISIISGVCFEIWSIYFFIKAGWCEGNSERHRLWSLFFGSLCGALTFGCRPPIGLCNIILIPVFVQVRNMYGRQGFKNILKMVTALSPYLVIGIALGWYNYARFDSPFEFGASYQLTLADMKNHPWRGGFARVVSWVIKYFFAYERGVAGRFPFVPQRGVFFNFPILLFFFLIFNGLVYNFLRERKLHFFIYTMAALPAIIASANAYAAPILVERYRLDFYFLLCILSFVAFCSCYAISTEHLKKHFRLFTPVALLATLTAVFLLSFNHSHGGNLLMTYKNLDQLLVSSVTFQWGSQ